MRPRKLKGSPGVDDEVVDAFRDMSVVSGNYRLGKTKVVVLKGTEVTWTTPSPRRGNRARVKGLAPAASLLYRTGW